ncbi:hypothetical protein OPQ81_001188 [Rhizoctonia solani]|nr:hypothetical protein OPQ81_001188 [Rhizoctonia solani]
MLLKLDAELDLAELYHATEETKYLALALCILLICETLATLPAEVRHVWNSPWSFGRIMFHANRIWAPIMLAIYVPSALASAKFRIFLRVALTFLWLQVYLCTIYRKRRTPFYIYNNSLHSSNDNHYRCLAYWLFYIYGSVVIQVIVASVLIARIWAIYQMKIWALVALCLGCVTLSTPSIVLLQMQASRTHLMKNPAPESISGCPTTINPLAFLPCLPPFVAETILFILTIYRPLKMNRQVKTPLMSRLILHGTQYYVVVFATLVFIVIGSLFPRTNHVVNGSGLIVAVWSIVCSQLILSGRSWYDKSKIVYASEKLEMATLPHPGCQDDDVSWRIDVRQKDSEP